VIVFPREKAGSTGFEFIDDRIDVVGAKSRYTGSAVPTVNRNTDRCLL